jgi:protein SCO1
MQEKTAQTTSATLDESGNALRNMMRFALLASLIGFGTGISNAATNGSADHAMPGMSGMDMKNMPATGMKDMPAMKPMDPAMHMAPLPPQGHYTSTVESYKVPDLKMVDEHGKPVLLPALLTGDAPVMLNFIFTTCTTLCPVMSATFQNIQAKLGSHRKDVRLVSVSIDPENDTPARLTEYAARFKAGPQWTFLTGTMQQSVDVQMAFGIFAGEKMNHTPVTFIRAKGAGKRWVRIDGLASADQVIKEYDKLAASN